MTTQPKRFYLLFLVKLCARYGFYTAISQTAFLDDGLLALAAGLPLIARRRDTGKPQDA